MLFIGILFIVIMVVMFIIDLGIINRNAHAISFREATVWSAVWIGLAMLFNLVIFYFLGHEKGLEFFTGYIVEKSLSVDNIFVFIMIFTYFNISAIYQPTVLKWGIIGALVMRGILIVIGVELLEMFHWMIYMFGMLLVITGIKMIITKEEKFDLDKNPILRVIRKIIPIATDLHNNKFFVKLEGKYFATPIIIVIILIEFFDLVFAIDSIPAVLGITKDPFIAYTSNIFAILGLRALFFMVANIINLFVYLKAGISVILCFVGVKMLITDLYQIHVLYSLLFIISVLTISILASLIIKRNDLQEQRR